LGGGGDICEGCGKRVYFAEGVSRRPLSLVFLVAVPCRAPGFDVVRPNLTPGQRHQPTLA
jgi:hypothetical protein